MYGALLATQLEFHTFARYGIGHHSSFLDRERRGLLHVNVLPCDSSFHRGLRMPVVRRTDDHGIDVFIGNQVTVVVVGFHVYGRLPTVSFCLRSEEHTSELQFLM